jgi:hypothetical protein
LSDLAYLVDPRPGLSNARNKGTAALGRIVAFIDDGARASPSSAKELLHAHAAFDGRAGIVGGPIVPRRTDKKPAWVDEPSLSYLKVIDLGRALCELSAGEWLAGCNISFDRVSLIAAGGSPPRLGWMGSGWTLLSNEEIEASARVRAMGKLAIYTHKAVVEHVIPRERLTQSWFRRRARLAGCLGLAEQTGACARSRCNSAARPIAKERRRPAIWPFAKWRGAQERHGHPLQSCDCRPLGRCRGDAATRWRRPGA